MWMVGGCFPGCVTAPSEAQRKKWGGYEYEGSTEPAESEAPTDEYYDQPVKEKRKRKKRSKHSSDEVDLDAIQVDVAPEPEHGGGHGGHVEPKVYDMRSPGFLARRGCKAAGVTLFIVCFVLALINWPSSLVDSKNARKQLMTVLFVVALALLVVEDFIDYNKGAIMLMVACSMWTFMAVSFHPHKSEENREEMDEAFLEGLADVGAVIMFLLPAMAVVESMDHLDAFSIVQRIITRVCAKSKYLLFPCLTLIVFFLSAVIDNLTATIVALKIVKLLVPDDKNFRHTLGGLIVITANSGGAWSPVGDVTTTMLWLKNDISTGKTILWLFFPSLVSCVIPLVGLVWQIRMQDRKSAAAKGAAGEAEAESAHNGHCSEGECNRSASLFVLCLGIGMILLVPILKMVTGLPPYMGMLLALGTMWFATDTAWFQALLIKDTRDHMVDGTPVDLPPMTEPRNLPQALHKMDLTGLLFFIGVLFAVGALNTAGVLEELTEFLVEICGGSPAKIATLLGISSAVVDNVPLVQACIDMFGSSTGLDEPLWQLIALAAGTGGSMLSVGSIAGVTYMAMEGVSYLWYVRRISFWAVLGFFGGVLSYQLEHIIFGSSAA